MDKFHEHGSEAQTQLVEVAFEFDDIRAHEILRQDRRFHNTPKTIWEWGCTAGVRPESSRLVARFTLSRAIEVELSHAVVTLAVMEMLNVLLENGCPELELSRVDYRTQRSMQAGLDSGFSDVTMEARSYAAEYLSMFSSGNS